jgi:hypothetical protein
MYHRHLNHDRMTLAAVDDIIVRGKLADWLELRSAVLSDRHLAGRILGMCRQRLERDEHPSQRHYFWRYYLTRFLEYPDPSQPDGDGYHE